MLRAGCGSRQEKGGPETRPKSILAGPGTRNASFRGGTIVDLAAGGVRVGEAIGLEPVGLSERTARACTVADSVIRDGGHIFLAGMGVLVQAAANTTVTHNDISEFRQTGISVGWTWNYG